ncbi:MAG: hypothetical protein MJY66_03145 [Bacteroidaceae bacterium]|nr:hypothetical protein [Bacteroidaceae bacterium]
MKKFVNILLVLCIIGLAYIYYGSIMGPINFQNEKDRRSQAVISRLVNIKDAQMEYHHQHGGLYTENFDTLIEFVKTGKLPVIKKVGDLTDDQLDADWTENKVLALYKEARQLEDQSHILTGYKGTKAAKEAQEKWQTAIDAGFITIDENGEKNFVYSRDTVWVSLYDSLYHGSIDPDSLRYIPFGNGAEFEMTTSCDTTKSGNFQYSFEAMAPYKIYLDGLDKQEVFNLIDECDQLGRYPGMRVDNNSGNWE